MMSNASRLFQRIRTTNGTIHAGGSTFLDRVGYIVLFGTLLMTRNRKPLAGKRIAAMSALGLVLLISLIALGCGESSSNKPGPGSQVNLLVTGTSGTISHSVPVSITVK